MDTTKLRKDLEKVKNHLENIDHWVIQVLDLLYEIEDQLLDGSNEDVAEKIKWLGELYNKRVWK